MIAGMKTAFYTIADWEREYLEGKLAGVGVEAEYISTPLKKETLAGSSDAEIISVFVDSVVDKAVLDNFPNLKFIAARSTGFDHIDLATAKARNIPLSYVPSYGENTVAEQAFALLLAVSRKIYQAFDQIKETGSFSQANLQGFDLRGKTIGVVGTGRIGRHAIQMAKGFGMKVVAYDPFPNEAMAKELDFTYLPLPELLAASDVVTLHVPYMKETHHLINAETIKNMKPGAVLINTARGPVVETAALVSALKNGKLGGAGLDVLEEEGVIKDEFGFMLHGKASEHDLKTVLANHILIDLPNVVITPHNAFNTKEAIQRIHDTTIENIKAFLAGNSTNLVK